MNVITFNERLERALKATYHESAGKVFNAVKTKPLLTLSLDAEEQLQTLIDAVAASDRIAFPFKQFRFLIKVRDIERGSGAVQFCGCFWVVPEGECWVMWQEDTVNGIAQQIYVAYPGNMIAFEWAGNRYENGEDMKDRHNRLLQLLEFLCVSYTNPANHVAKVTPDKPGKSVEWRQAREHYTLVHRTHAANNAAVAPGSTVKQDESAHIKRIAHSRRAHFRILKSDRYKNAKGQKIFIRSTWVGPKEWKDTAGQIYTIVK